MYLKNIRKFPSKKLHITYGILRSFSDEGGKIWENHEPSDFP